MRIHHTIALSAVVGTIALAHGALTSLAAISGDDALIDAGAAPGSMLPSAAQAPFQEYLIVPKTFGSKAFAVAPESGQWGQSTALSRPGIAAQRAIEDCSRGAARDCRLFAVGNIVVFGLADWQIEVAIMLDQVKPGATNGDLEAVTSANDAATVAALRRSVLHAAAEMGSTDAMAAMLDLGIDVDAGSDIGATALSYAASRGHHVAVQLLLDRGADINARNGVGMTPLGLAVLANNFARQRTYLAADHDATVRLLKDAGGIE